MEPDAAPQSLGHLNPGTPELSFDRFELGDGLGELVRHIWVAQWRVPVGQSRRQRVLAYPAYNAVFRPTEAGLFGADPRLSIRDLTGTSWAVGILFRPAAGVLLSQTAPIDLLRSSESLMCAPVAAVALAMGTGPDARAELVPILRHWLLPLAGSVNDRGRLVNEVCRVAEEDDSILRATQLASQVGVSPRTLQRVVMQHVGVSPKWLIECRRLQQAATTLASLPDVELSSLAIELGFSDYSHFSRRYKAILGETPEQTRRESGRCQ